MTSFAGLFAGIRNLWRRAAVKADSEEQLARRGNQLAVAEARLGKLRTGYAKLNDRVAIVERRLKETKASLRASRAESARWRRRALSSRVLRDLLPARREQLSARAAARCAVERDERLLAVAAPYADAIRRNRPPSADAIATELDGLKWWVPVGTAGSRWDRKAGREQLPYRGLIHAREVCTGGIMLDLGAHTGSTSIPRVILGDVEACYCAEPEPVNYACLVANVLENGLRGFVLPDRVALGAHEGTARLKPHKSSRGHHLSDDGTIEVRVRTLDAWVSDLGVDPRAISFIKSDIQGYELHMLRGAPLLLACRHIAWQLEFAPRLLAAAGGSSQDFFELLERHFTHFIDLNAWAAGRRVRSIGAVREALAYVDSGEKSHTDVIVYAASGGAR